MKEFRERRIMILMRSVLFLTGGTVGALAMWQAIDVIALSFPPVIVTLCYLASVLFLGGLLCLSAPPLRAGFHNFSALVRKKFKSVKAVDIAGIVIGLLAGFCVAFLTELLFELFLGVLALRIVIDAGFGLLAAFLTAIAVSGFVTAEQSEQRDEPVAEVSRGTRGYLLTEAALCDPKIITLCGQWLDGNIYVLSHLADALAANAEESESAAFTHFKALYHARKIRILEWMNDDVLEAAEQKKLKVIAAASDSKIQAGKRVTVLVIGGIL